MERHLRRRQIQGEGSEQAGPPALKQGGPGWWSGLHQGPHHGGNFGQLPQIELVEQRAKLRRFLRCRRRLDGIAVELNDVTGSQNGGIPVGPPRPWLPVPRACRFRHSPLSRMAPPRNAVGKFDDGHAGQPRC
jgi:hypothetical protein